MTMEPFFEPLSARDAWFLYAERPETPLDLSTVYVFEGGSRVPGGRGAVGVEETVRERIHLDEPLTDDPYLVAEFSTLPDVLVESREVEALTRNVQSLFARVIALVPYLPEELQLAAANVEDPSALCHLVASTIRIKTDEKQRLLELVDVEERFQLWRFRHMMTVHRIIGFKPGTGGSSGVPFLKRALDVRFFPELWDVRTELEPPR